MSNDNSYALPPLVSQTTSVTRSGGAQATASTSNNMIAQIPAKVVNENTPSTKDYIFGGVILIILAILFFLVARQFSNHLVKKKHRPSSANNAGIWLFVLLFDISVIAVIGIFDAGILSLLQVSIPLAVLAIVFLVLLLMSTQR
jgi:surface polysaccharide O-acyltransferase-like enzyme